MVDGLVDGLLMDGLADGCSEVLRRKICELLGQTASKVRGYYVLVKESSEQGHAPACCRRQKGGDVWIEVGSCQASDHAAQIRKS